MGKKHLRLNPQVHPISADSECGSSSDYAGGSSSAREGGAETNPDVVGEPDNGHSSFSCIGD